MAVLNQNPFNQEQDQNKDLTNISTGGSGGPTAAPQAPQAGSSQAPARQGSGRFTNLQRFTEANQGGGQRIAGAVGQRVQERLGEKEREAQTQAQAVGQAIEDTDTKVRAAAQSYQDTFNNPEFNATQFVQGTPVEAQGAPVQTEGQAPQVPNVTEGQQAPDQVQGTMDQVDGQIQSQGFQYDPTFGGFVDFQSGRYIDQQGISQNLTQAQMAQMQAANEANMLNQALMQEESGEGIGGRFGLLRDTFGRGNSQYTRGLQRLDQALLQTQAPEALSGLQQSVANRAQGLVGLGEQLGVQGQRFQDLLGFQSQAQEQLRGRVEDLRSQGMSEVEAQTQARIDSLRDMQGQGRQDAEMALRFLQGRPLAGGELTTAIAPTPEQAEAVRRGLATLGISEDTTLAGNLGADLDLNRFISDNFIGGPLSDFKTQEQANRLNALQQLSELENFREGQFQAGKFGEQNPELFSRLNSAPDIEKLSRDAFLREFGGERLSDRQITEDVLVGNAGYFGGSGTRDLESTVNLSLPELINNRERIEREARLLAGEFDRSRNIGEQMNEQYRLARQYAGRNINPQQYEAISRALNNLLQQSQTRADELGFNRTVADRFKGLFG